VSDRVVPRDVKIFCIGAGKTGTTSLESFFRSLGYRVGEQAKGELLLKSWADGRFEPIIDLCHTAQVFQDMPFNCPGTFRELDQAFPHSKFILSVRDSAHWYASLTRFHTAIVGSGNLPTRRELKAFPYCYEGWILDALTLVYGVTEDNPYCKQVLIDAYERHNAEVQRYFEQRREALLVVDLSESDTARRIMEFTGHAYRGERMPHENRASRESAGRGPLTTSDARPTVSARPTADE
jgi:hypothetical protein